MRLLAGIVGLLTASVLGAGSASAGYLSLGIGDAAELDGQMEQQFQRPEDASSARLAVGQRMGPAAIEAALSGSELGDTRTVSLSIDVKLYHNLAGPLDLYGRGGIGKTWMSHPFVGDDEYSGRNKQLGAGLLLSFDAPIGHMGLFVDLSRQWLDLQSDRMGTLDGELDTVQLGVSVGL